MTGKDFGANPDTSRYQSYSLVLCVHTSGKVASILLVLGLVYGLFTCEGGHVEGSTSDPSMLAASLNLLLTDFASQLLTSTGMKQVLLVCSCHCCSVAS